MKTGRITPLLALVGFASFVAPLQAQETAPLLRWKNGDVLPGKLLGSGPDQIRWSSPHFSEGLTVDTEALDSVNFPKQSVQPTEIFRVGTVSGDFWNADLIGSDENTFLFSSQRYGQFRVNRNAVYSLNRRAHPNLAFDGSQFKVWTLAQEGAIKDLTYKVYEGDRKWGDKFPDFSKLTPVDKGSFAAGYLDLELSELKDSFAMLFEGQLETPLEGDYSFDLSADDHARLFIDDQLIVDSHINVAARVERQNGKVKLDAGSHSLRVEYLDYGGTARLSAWWKGPDLKDKSLVGINTTSGWRRGPGGHPQTDRQKTSIFRTIEMPKRFELDLELTSIGGPRFVVAIGKDKISAESNQSLRLETWDNELVVVQDEVFEPVMTIEDDQHDVRLRLAFDSDSGELQVFDSNGRSLVIVKGIQATTGESGIYIRNRGDDLTVRRLRVYRLSTDVAPHAVDSAKPRVHLVDGQAVYGRLFVEEGGA